MLDLDSVVLEKFLATLLRHKLVHHDRTTYDGYRLTTLGYDYLAMRTFLARETIKAIGHQIGVGKESDIFLVEDNDNDVKVMKLHRLGRTSFRSVKEKRDYHGKRHSPSWIYLSRISAMKENAFMKILHKYGFPIPTPVDANRHCVIMSLVDGFNLNDIKVLEEPEKIYLDLMKLIERFAQHGLIHGDFNEFNIMLDSHDKIVVIDFPQIISMHHPNAQTCFERDVNCIVNFFRKRFNFIHEKIPNFEYCLNNISSDLGTAIKASGYNYKNKVDDTGFLNESQQREHNYSNDIDEVKTSETVISAEYSPEKNSNYDSIDSNDGVQIDHKEINDFIPNIFDKLDTTDTPSDPLNSNAITNSVQYIDFIQKNSNLEESKQYNKKNVTYDTKDEKITEDEDPTLDSNDQKFSLDLNCLHISEDNRTNNNIQKKVRKEFNKISNRNTIAKAKRNIVKSRDKRKVHKEIQTRGEWYI